MKKMLLGIAIGDALGVPYEFKSRNEMKISPCVDMVGNGSHNQPVGTWSDDTSLTLCTAEAIAEGFDLEKLADKFVNWRYNNYMVAGSEVFDVGHTSSLGIKNLLYRKKNKMKPEDCGILDMGSNGNGALMRIMPLAWYIYLENKENRMFRTHMERFNFVSKVAKLTHGHFISSMACHILVEFAIQLIHKGHLIDKIPVERMWLQTASVYKNFIDSNKDVFDEDYIKVFNRLLSPNFKDLPMDNIYAGGFVIHTLEATIWCLLNTSNYRDCVLKAVNLGEDTDTTAGIAGGLAGILYGEEGIPSEWKEKLLKRELIESIGYKMLNFLNVEEEL